MKKLLGVCAVLALLIGGGSIAYQMYYSGDAYYVKITTDGEAKVETDTRGEKHTIYHYSLPAVNKKLKNKTIAFTADHNLKRDAYLELTFNDKKGVTTWQEVKAADIKATILEEIN